jgi:ribonuclease T1
LTLAFVAWIGCGFQAQAGQGGSRHAHETVVQATRLDRGALLTLRRIRSGGPFPYAKDGIVFGNHERQLPHKPRGYYREYTVPTPGSRDRGARRIVCGGAPRSPDVCYYTHDHYASFQFIAG